MNAGYVLHHTRVIQGSRVGCPDDRQADVLWIRFEGKIKAKYSGVVPLHMSEDNHSSLTDNSLFRTNVELYHIYNIHNF